MKTLQPFLKMSSVTFFFFLILCFFYRLSIFNLEWLGLKQRLARETSFTVLKITQFLTSQMFVGFLEACFLNLQPSALCYLYPKYPFHWACSISRPSTTQKGTDLQIWGATFGSAVKLWEGKPAGHPSCQFLFLLTDHSLLQFVGF